MTNKLKVISVIAMIALAACGASTPETPFNEPGRYSGSEPPVTFQIPEDEPTRQWLQETVDANKGNIAYNILIVARRTYDRQALICSPHYGDDVKSHVVFPAAKYILEDRDKPFAGNDDARIAEGQRLLSEACNLSCDWEVDLWQDHGPCKKLEQYQEALAENKDE